MPEQGLWTAPCFGGIVRKEDGECELRAPSGRIGQLGKVVFARELEDAREEEGRAYRLSVRLSRSEMEALQRKAERAGLSVSLSVRAVLAVQRE